MVGQLYKNYENAQVHRALRIVIIGEKYFWNIFAAVGLPAIFLSQLSESCLIEKKDGAWWQAGMSRERVGNFTYYVTEPSSELEVCLKAVCAPQVMVWYTFDPWVLWFDPWGTLMISRAISKVFSLPCFPAGSPHTILLLMNSLAFRCGFSGIALEMWEKICKLIPLPPLQSVFLHGRKSWVITHKAEDVCQFRV